MSVSGSWIWDAIPSCYQVDAQGDAAGRQQADQPDIDHRLDDARHKQVEPGESEQQHQGQCDLGCIGFEKHGNSK